MNWDFPTYVPLANSTELQRLHWYPAPFPPALAGTLIEILGVPRGRMLDPFAGSGVAAIEAWLRGMDAVGIDNNPIAVEIGRAKVSLVRSGDTAVAARLAKAYEQYRGHALTGLRALPLAQICRESGMHTDASRWFTPETLREIAVAKNWIEQGRGSARAWRDVLRVVLSSTLLPQLSTVRRYHYTYVVDRSRVALEDRTDVDVPAIFMSRLLRLCIDASLVREQLRRLGTPVEMLQEVTFRKGLAQDAANHTRDIDLVVTSPPYFGMNDYVRSQYLSWLVFQWPGFNADIESESGSRRARNSRPALARYFADMSRVFAEVRASITPGRYLVVIVGQSRARSLEGVDVVSTLDDIIAANAFHLYWSGTRRVRFRKINNVPYTEEQIRVFV